MHHSTGNPHFVFWKKLRVAACVMEFYIDGAEVLVEADTWDFCFV